MSSARTPGDYRNTSRPLSRPGAPKLAIRSDVLGFLPAASTIPRSTSPRADESRAHSVRPTGRRMALLSVDGRGTTGIPRAQTRQPTLLPRPYMRQRSAMYSFLSDEAPSTERIEWRRRSRVLHRREGRRAGRTRTPTARSPSPCRSRTLAPHGSSPLVVGRLAPATGREPLVQQRRNRTAHQAHAPTRLLRPAKPRTRRRANSQVERSDPHGASEPAPRS